MLTTAGRREYRRAVLKLHQWLNGDRGVLAAFAGLKLLLHLPVLHRFGFHADELYFVACGVRPAFGYVDHPPLVPWVAGLANMLFGPSLVGLRLFAVLAGVATVFLAGEIARRLGGGRIAQALAALTVLIAPVYLRTANMLATTSAEALFWTLGFLLVVSIVQAPPPARARLWLWLGFVVGLGLLNKHTMLFFGFAVVVGVILSPLRSELGTPRPYLAGGLALLMFLPNIVWQIQNDWPTVAFIANLNLNVMSQISFGQFLFGQFLYLNPVGAIVWLSGLVWLLRSGKGYRVLGLMWLTVFLVLALAKSKIYYLAPAYPVLMAAGGVALEQWIVRRQKVLRASLSFGVLALAGAVLVPLSLPMLSLATTERWMGAITFGKMGNIQELTGDLRAMYGWRERVEAVAEVFHGLTAEERRSVVILASDNAIAGAIDLYGGEYGLPKAHSMHLSYWLWGPPPEGTPIVIAASFKPGAIDKAFKETTLAASVDIENVRPGQNPFQIMLCRHMTRSWAELWYLNRPRVVRP